MHFDTISGLVFSAIFLLALSYRFIQNNRECPEDRDALAVAWSTLVVFGIPLSIGFVVLHFIIKYW